LRRGRGGGVKPKRGVRARGKKILLGGTQKKIAKGKRGLAPKGHAPPFEKNRQKMTHQKKTPTRRLRGDVTGPTEKKQKHVN